MTRTGEGAGAEANGCVLDVSGLVKRYRNTVAVDDLSLRVGAGEIVGLVGPNGAGKTTALRCISGVLRPSGGTIRVGGHDVVDAEREAKQLLALVPEMPNPYELLTVREHLQLVARAYGTERILEDRGEEVLRRLSLAERRDDLVLSLSKGMKQKLAVACAFVHGARLYLLDEPLMGMDPKAQREFMLMVREAVDDGAGALVSTHILDTAERACDRIVVLNEGRKIAEGTVDDLRERAAMHGGSLEDVFLVLTGAAETVE